MTRFDTDKVLSNWRIQLLIVVTILALCLVFMRDLNPTTVDLNLGIEFVGGVRIPITLERSVDQDTMASVTDQIKQRINKFGLSQAVVRPVGDREVLVEIPQADEKAIENVQRLLREEGKFEAIIGGVQALDGRDVIGASVGGASERIIPQDGGGYGYEIGFTATNEGGAKFAKAAFGKPNFPVYMFLDRPENAVIVIDRGFANKSTNPVAFDRAVREALDKQGDAITLAFEDEITASNAATILGNKTIVVVSNTLLTRNSQAYAAIKAQGYVENTANASRKLVARSDDDMRPETYVTQLSETIVSKWPAIGLISGPTLSPSLANGVPQSLPSYLISGTGSGATADERKASAVSELKIMKIVLTQGKLPVTTVIGSTYSISPSLGKQFFDYSAVGILLAVGIVAAMIIIRYRNGWLALPIVIINSTEIIITLAIVGSFTLDLAAMAGVITLIGTGVDDQIIITDELLHKKKTAGKDDEDEKLDASGVKQRIGKAFEIIMTNATVAIIAMLPLLLSGIVEITGFAMSYIVGVLVGVFITRPAYGVLVGEIAKKI